jgi:hypothetical protein
VLDVELLPWSAKARELVRQQYAAVGAAASGGVGAKRALAVREFALGLEALERFVAHQPLRHIHECVFGVLAFESEPVDPRL